MKQARSPALDLDSLYGAGPANEGSKRFYRDDGRHLRMGRTEAVGSGPLDAHEGFDLPRSDARKLATIPDRRNDENLAVAQTHLAFARFHNRVLARSAPCRPRTASRRPAASSSSTTSG